MDVALWFAAKCSGKVPYTLFSQGYPVVINKWVWLVLVETGNCSELFFHRTRSCCCKFCSSLHYLLSTASRGICTTPWNIWRRCSPAVTWLLSWVSWISSTSSGMPNDCHLIHGKAIGSVCVFRCFERMFGFTWFVFPIYSKRSNFITRLTPDKKQGLVVRLTHLAEVDFWREDAQQKLVEHSSHFWHTTVFLIETAKNTWLSSCRMVISICRVGVEKKMALDLQSAVKICPALWVETDFCGFAKILGPCVKGAWRSFLKLYICSPIQPVQLLFILNSMQNGRTTNRRG